LSSSSCSCTGRSSPRKAFPRFSSVSSIIFCNQSSPCSRTASLSPGGIENCREEHHEINRKAQATNQSVTSLMGELQHTEAKQADFKHTISENEDEIDRIASRLENQKKQIKKD
jgi:septal ring factor EnvC (AmiA/AmiB activator)